MEQKALPKLSFKMVQFNSFQDSLPDCSHLLLLLVATPCRSLPQASSSQGPKSSACCARCARGRLWVLSRAGSASIQCLWCLCSSCCPGSLRSSQSTPESLTNPVPALELWLATHGSQDPFGGLMTLSWGSHIRYPACQIL